MVIAYSISLFVYIMQNVTPVLSIKMAASNFFSYTERNRMTLSADIMMTINDYSFLDWSKDTSIRMLSHESSKNSINVDNLL